MGESGGRALRRTGRRALLGQVGVSARREHALAGGHLRDEPGEEPLHPIHLVALCDRAGMREVGEGEQRTVAAVDAVEVQVARAHPRRRDPGDRAEGLAAAGTRGTDDEEVTEVVQVDERRVLLLVRGVVLDAVGEGARGGAEGAHERLDRHLLRERGQPGARLVGDPERGRGLADRRDEGAQVGVGGILARGVGARGERCRLGEIRERQGADERLGTRVHAVR